jgi:uncharacterized membrane protein
MPISAPAPASGPERAFHPLDVRQARARVVLAAGAGVATSLLLSIMPRGFAWATRVVAGWDAGATVFLFLAWAIILRSDTGKTRRRAAAQDPGRTAAWATVLVASTFSLFAAVALLRRAKDLAPTETASLAALCLVAVVTSWALTHTAYTLRYAHLYYRDDDEGEGGLEFPGNRAPDYFDFAYFAFTLGMTFQVSDVSITSPIIRRAALGHSVLGFAYNTAILALVLNLTFGLLG